MAMYDDRDRDEEDDGKKNKGGKSRIEGNGHGRYNACQAEKYNM